MQDDTRRDSVLAPARWRDTAPLLILSTAVTVVDGGLVLAIIREALPLWTAVGLHGVLTGGITALAMRARSPRAARALWLLAVSHGGLGPVGAAGTLISLALGLHYDRQALPVDEWRRALFPDPPRDEDAELWALVGARGGERLSTVAPFVDVLDHGTLEQKQAAVALMARHFRPAFAPALRLALRDPQNAVRVQAATAVSMIEARATARALELERRRREQGDDPRLLLDLARHEDAYAFTGLLDPSRERESRSRALAAYRAYLECRPDDDEARTELGRLLFRLGRHAEALACFDTVRARHDTPGIRLWIMECLFHLQRYDALRRLARASEHALAGAGEPLPVETAQVLRLWALAETHA